jgi:hypothetical protein
MSAAAGTRVLVLEDDKSLSEILCEEPRLAVPDAREHRAGDDERGGEG